MEHVGTCLARLRVAEGNAKALGITGRVGWIYGALLLCCLLEHIVHKSWIEFVAPYQLPAQLNPRSVRWPADPESARLLSKPLAVAV